MLLERIEGLPSGGETVWATYYFRDRGLARALVAASDRGVKVTVRVEEDPRLAGANDAVIAILREHGLKGGLFAHRGSNDRKGIRPHLHSKIYYFSHPKPSVLVGSYNPSGDTPEDESVLAEIGDQDRGHNVLVDLTDPPIVKGLRRAVLSLPRPLTRWRPLQNLPISGESETVWLYPRLRPLIIERHIGELGKRSRIFGSVSHLKRSEFTDALVSASARGISVRLFVHDTERRVPENVVRRLAAAGVEVARYDRGWRCPLHAKFLVLEQPGSRHVYFGSLNFNKRSRRYNHEVLIRSGDPDAIDHFGTRFDQIAEEVAKLNI